MGYSDTDVAEYLYKYHPSLDKLVAYLCKDLSKACAVKPPPVPKVLHSYTEIDGLASFIELIEVKFMIKLL